MDRYYHVGLGRGDDSHGRSPELWRSARCKILPRNCRSGILPRSNIPVGHPKSLEKTKQLMVLRLTLWYKRYEVQGRMAVFYTAASLSGAFSGILAYGIEHMDGIAGLGGWRW